MKKQFQSVLLTSFLIYWFSFSASGQCVGPDPFLGNDTSLCSGQSLTLNPGTFADYLWNNNSTQATRSVSQAGTYSVRVAIAGANLIVNGDFEQGNTAFSTDYIPGTGGTYGLLSNEGQFAVTTSPSLAHNNFNACQDHTPTPGVNMLVVNGSSTPNTSVWCQTVAVSPNTDYNFSTWVSSAIASPVVAELQFNINGSALGGIFSPPSSACTWTPFNEVWNSGVSVSANICIKNQNIQTSGNDFMIDDIRFAPICYKYDTIVVGVTPSPIITASANDTICLGETANITASSSSSNLTYTWNPGAIQSSQLQVSPAVTTIYTVTASDAQGCVSNLLTRIVKIQTSPTVSISANNTTICEGLPLVLTASSNDPNVSYSWMPNSSSTNVLNDTPLINTSYSVIAENAFNCKAYDTIDITVIPAFEIQITGDLSVCEGEAVELTVSGNNPNLFYEWSDGSVGETFTFIPTQNTSISVTGNYFSCPQGKDTVDITIIPFPILSVPSNFFICPQETITATATTDIPATINWISLGSTGNSQTFTVPTSSYIYLNADNQGCVSVADSFFVDASAVCSLEIPNVFTPNNDGNNDSFSLISFSGIIELNCSIFNRWGNEVRTFDTPNFSWDGKDKHGNSLNSGVFFYKITGKTSGNIPFEKQGFVQLIRN